MTAERKICDPGSMRALADLTASERAILALVRRHPGVSRAGIAQALNLSPALLSKAVAAFQEAGLIVEGRDPAPRGRGQPARQLRIRPGQVAGLGVSLSTKGIALAVQDLDGTLLDSHWIPISAAETAPALAATLDGLDALRRRARSSCGIGLWLPALQDLSGRVIEVTPSQRAIDHEAWTDALSARFDCDLWLESKAPAYHAALTPGQAEHGVYMLFLDYGIGGSLIDRMQLYRGSFGEASNIGAMVPDNGPRPSLPDLTRYLGRAEGMLSHEELEQLAAVPPPALHDWMASRGETLSYPLSTVVHLLNPATIVIGGLFPRPILQGLAEHIRLDRLDHPGRRPLTRPALRVARDCGPRAMGIAATSVPLTHGLSPEAPPPLPLPA